MITEQQTTLNCVKRGKDFYHDCKNGSAGIMVGATGHQDVLHGFGFAGTDFVTSHFRFQVVQGYCLGCKTEATYRVTNSKHKAVVKKNNSIAKRIKKAAK